jgi:hypothetical protein
MIVEPALGPAFARALSLIERRTRPGDAVAVLPEGTALLFFTDRRNPLTEEIAVPGFLDETRARGQLTLRAPRLVLIANRATPEYGPAHFGQDYAQSLQRLIEERYESCGVLGPTLPSALVFRAYCLREP